MPGPLRVAYIPLIHFVTHDKEKENKIKNASFDTVVSYKVSYFYDWLWMMRLWS